MSTLSSRAWCAELPDSVVGIQDVAMAFSELARRLEGGGYASSPRELGGDMLEEESSGGGVLASFAPRVKDVGELTWSVKPCRPVAARFYGVDAGCRTLDSTRVVVVVYGAAVAHVDGFIAAGTYPYTGCDPYVDLSSLVHGGDRVLEFGSAPLVAYGPSRGSGFPGFVADRPLVDPKAYAAALGVHDDRLEGLGYGCGFDRETLRDENRILLETMAVAWCLSRRGGGEWYVLLDGPIFSTPGLYVAVSGLRGSYSRVKAYYALSYLVNTLLRVHMLYRLSGGSLHRVAGVVKRVSSARLAVRALRLAEGRDVELVGRLASRTSRGGAITLGPFFTVLRAGDLFKAVLSGGGSRGRSIAYYSHYSSTAITRLGHTIQVLEHLAEGELKYIVKRSYYLAVRGLDGGLAVARVEFLHPFSERRAPEWVEKTTMPAMEDVEEYVREDLHLLSYLAWFMALPSTSTQPLPIAVADRVSKRLSRFLALTCFHMLRDHTDFTYETLSWIAGG